MARWAVIGAVAAVPMELLAPRSAQATIINIQAGNNPDHFDLFTTATPTDTITIQKDTNSSVSLTYSSNSTGLSVPATGSIGSGNGKTASLAMTLVNNANGSASAGNKTYLVTIHNASTSQTDPIETVTASVYDHALVTAPTVTIRLTQGQTATSAITLQNLLNSSVQRDDAKISAISAGANGFTTTYSGTTTIAASDSVFNTAFNAQFIATQANITAGLSKNFTITYGDTNTTYTGANGNNQSATLTVNATIDKLSELVNTNTNINSGRTSLGSVAPIKTGTGTYIPGVLTNINGGSGASKGTVTINMGAANGQTAQFGSDKAIILLDFVSTTNLSQLTADLASFGYSYTTTGDQLTGAFSTYDLEFSMSGITGSTDYFDFDYSKYGLLVKNVAVVPEPTSCGMLLSAGIGYLLTRRKRTNKR